MPSLLPSVACRPRTPCIARPCCRTSRDRRVAVHAKSMGFLPAQEEIQEQQPLEEGQLQLPGGDVVVPPKSMYGLSPEQMLAMGIAGDSVERVQQGITEVCALPGRSAQVAAWRAWPSRMRGSGFVICTDAQLCRCLLHLRVRSSGAR